MKNLNEDKLKAGFADFMEEKCDAYQKEMAIATVPRLIVFLPIIAVGFIFGGGFWIITALGFAGLIAIAYYLFSDNKEMKDGLYWKRVIKSSPKSIVWIKPITVKHTALHIVTLYKEREFMLYTTGKYSTVIKWNSDKEIAYFLHGAQLCFPNAHIGYSEEITTIFKANPYKFIEELTKRNLYLPVISLTQ